MEVIVLAGGLGTRLRRALPDLPKPMAPVAGHPFLEIVLTGLKKKRFSRVILSLGYMAENIVSYFGSRFGSMELVYEIEQIPLGTGGAVRAAMQHCTADHVFIVNGDTYLDLEIAKVERLWQKNRLPIIVAHEVDDTSRYGRLEIKGGKVQRFIEKGVGGKGIINAGTYVLPANALNGYAVGEGFSLERDYLSERVTRSQVNVFVSRGYFIDIGIPEDYERAQSEFMALRL